MIGMSDGLGGEAMYVHERTEAALAALTSEATDDAIIVAIANYMLIGRSAPIDLYLNHNAKASPCPLRIDAKKAGAKRSGVTMHDLGAAHSWVLEALRRGYEVTTLTRKGIETRSVAAERRSIESRAAMAEYRAKRVYGEVDDEIPF